jgi:hypothetical protein
MRIELLTASAFVLTLCGCSSVSGIAPRMGAPNVRLYPVQGPVAATSPGVVLKGKTVPRRNDGTFMYVLPDSTTCSGAWQVTKNKLEGRGEPVESIDPITGGGAGHRVKHFVSGGDGKGTCSNGATYTLVFEGNGNSAMGMVKDTSGNIFQIGFGGRDFGRPTAQTLSVMQGGDTSVKPQLTPSR